MRVGRVAAVAVALMLALSACGDDSAPEVEVADELRDKEPIVIGMTSQDSGDRSNRDYADGLQAWVDYTNSREGIDGRPIELERCDSKSVSDGEQQCSQSLATNDDVVAVSGMGGFVGTVSVPTYEKAKVPMISMTMFVEQEYQTPIGVALNGGLISTYAVLMKHFQDEGGTSASMLHVDVASAASVASQYERVGKELGLDWKGTTALSPTATDVLPTVTQALGEEPDMLLVQTHPAQLKAILQAMDTLRTDIPVLSAGGSITADIQSMPEARDRLYYTSDFADPSSDEANQDAYAFLEDRFGDDLTDPHVAGFILGAGFGQAIEESGGADATRESILEFVETGTFKDLPWMPSEISRTGASEDYPAVANLAAYAVKLDGDNRKAYVSDLIVPAVY